MFKADRNVFVFSISDLKAIAIKDGINATEKPLADQVEFFTEKNYQGNKFTVTTEGDYPIDRANHYSII